MRGRGNRTRGGIGAWLAAVVAAAALQAVALTPVTAQELIPAEYGPRTATRAQLNAMVDSLQAELGNYDVGSREHTATQRSVQVISRRLREGDVMAGDIVDLRIAGEDRWTMQHTVTPTRTIALESIEEVDVSGVLHSELEEKISLQLARYLRDPRVDAQVLKRIGVTGFVANPGFYTIEGSALVSDALMLAGGPGSGSNMNSIEFRRLGSELDIPSRVVWQSMSLDDLGVQSGDEMYVPQGGSSVGRFLLGALGLLGTLTFIAIRLF